MCRSCSACYVKKRKGPWKSKRLHLYNIFLYLKIKMKVFDIDCVWNCKFTPATLILNKLSWTIKQEVTCGLCTLGDLNMKYIVTKTWMCMSACKYMFSWIPVLNWQLKVISQQGYCFEFHHLLWASNGYVSVLSKQSHNHADMGTQTHTHTHTEYFRDKESVWENH